MNSGIIPVFGEILNNTTDLNEDELKIIKNIFLIKGKG